MPKPMKYPVKPLSAFMEGGITGDLKNVQVTNIKEVVRKKDTPKGKAGTPFRRNVQLTDSTAELWMEGINGVKPGIMGGRSRMSKPMKYPVKPLSAFMEGGITGDLKNVQVTNIKEVVRKKDTPKGKAGTPFRCNVQLTDSTAELWMEVWKPEAELPFKLNDVININEVHSDYNEYFKSYQVKSCSRSKVTIVDPSAQRKADTTEFLGKMDEITVDPTPIKPKSFEEVKTETIIIPAQPEHRPYFPAMSIFELRDYHLREQNGAIRGHIENIIMRKQKEMRDEEAKIQRTRIIELLEGMKK